MNKKKIFKSIITVVSIIIILGLSTTVYGRDNLAFSAGTTNGINTVEDVNDAMNSYSNAGYRRYSCIDPSRDTLWSYLYADVQFFPTHGSLTSISFTNSGIRVGNDSGNYIGTNSVHWDADTILVTYASCQGAGTNNNFSENSITYQTALRGSDVAVGFRDSVNDGSIRNWAKRYNDKLGSGSGVQDAVNHANSYIYVDSRVKQNHIVHHGDANMRIGRYRSSVVSDDERNILEQPIPLTARSSIDSTIISIMENLVPDFNIENYVIKETDGLMTTNVNTQKTEIENKYIDLQLKIGDFYTEAGYTVRISDNVIDAIYDNNIDKEKQNDAFKNINKFNVNISNIEVENMKKSAKNNLQTVYNTSKIIVNDNIDTIYYFDIETGKKYVTFSIPSKTENGDIAYNTIKYEI
ncbi:MAG: hypothetical protein K1W33_05525 [Clostridia bacterium]